ncbi:hypothetical protein, partial [Paraburkholderia ginsengiterrae]|uniref:hypothetical protein n=1 Tax=Paraburkholderia ginsengiterrae TaxID=1462993 RepID=UPI000AF1D73F
LSTRVAFDLEGLVGLGSAGLHPYHVLVGHRLGFVLVVGATDRREAEGLLPKADFTPHRVAQLGVERGERFIEQQQFRLRRDRARDRVATETAAAR